MVRDVMKNALVWYYCILFYLLKTSGVNGSVYKNKLPGWHFIESPVFNRIPL